MTEYEELERLERDNLDPEGASARFRVSDPIFDMENAYDSRPGVPQVGGQMDCFSQLPEGASAFIPQAHPTPTRARSGPAEGLSNFTTRASAAVARKFGNLTSSKLEVRASALGAALE